MARILLGVSGGISAYKAVELARLATKAGSRGARDPDAGERSSSSAARPSRASPARRCSSRSSSATRRGARIPGEPPPDHDPISHLELAAPLRRLLHRAGDREHDRQARRPATPTTSLTAAYLACTSPVLRRAGDEQPHVRAPGHAGEPRDACASAACT